MVGQATGHLHASINLLVLFDAVTVLSFVLIAAIVGTACSSKYVLRPRAWYGQMAQWMIYCISYMLLFGFQREVEPPRALCLFQASLIYACPPACAVGSACFMVDLYMSVLPLRQTAARRIRGLAPALIALPWVVLVCTALQVIVFVVRRSGMKVLHHGAFFCNVSNQEPTYVSVIVVILALVVLFYFEVQAGIIMYQNRLEFKRINYHHTSHIFVSVYIRSAILTVGMLMSTGLAIYCAPRLTEPSISWSILLPFMPIFVAIVFGSQQDIMRVWVFWRKRTSEKEDFMPSTSRLSLTLASEGIPTKVFMAA